MDDIKKISYHIFIFPFKWDYFKDELSFNKEINERINFEKFKTLLLETEYWEEEGKNIKEYIDYNQYVYFYKNVRKVIYGRNNTNDTNDKKILENKNINTQDELVKCFKFKGINENSKYVISLKNKEYSLKLTDIKLKIYKTGVANLIFFVENNEFEKKEDILKINDYGRRIYPQFLPLEKCRDNFLADISLMNISNNSSDKKSKPYISNFGEEKFKEHDFKEERLSSSINISSVITDILGESFLCEKCQDIKNKIVITPIIDDRMFVMSFLVDSLFSNLIVNGDYFSDVWYKYIFIDNGSCTCQNEEMKEKLIKESTYVRWSNYNTLYGITRYSFVVVANNNEFTDILINQFKTIYCEMVLLALTDRASLLRFKEEISRIAALDEERTLSDVTSLQKLYMCFSNSIYFREVTPQEQGIEMYDMLLAKMRIKEDVDSLENNIREMYNYTNGIYNNQVSEKVNFITYIGGKIGAVSLIISIMALITELVGKIYEQFDEPTIFYILLITIIWSEIEKNFIDKNIKKK
ncbi:hypothetical protein SAMN04487886_11133 [Clostridium sp. DSM 8431]|nr:hypothetical protein SAMN04487886_11133 [Clostridium sp. DSM 8431]